MTELLYQTDSYIKEFQASITAVDQPQHGIVLDQTAFYPGGGGQPHDVGRLSSGGNTYVVSRLKRMNNSYLHLLEGDDQLPSVGERVSAQIDWERRYKVMRTHTAMHILCGVIFRDYGALVTGGNMDPLKGRMDFEFEHMGKDLVAEIENAINTEVAKHREVSVAILPREDAFQIPDLIRTKINLLPEGIKEVRTIEIKGLDLQADGGTHVNNTREVGKIRVTDYKSKGKVNKRIYLELDG